MNLEQTIRWFTLHIDELKEQKADPKHIETAQKFLFWMSELNRYRLFMSEYQREIELTPEKNKKEQLQLLNDEIKDWNLDKDSVIE